ncbi:MAG: hypothetical protein OEM98_11520 [Gammaproteobacteria bacterium]|nr:hypothetical protein [Gammaproteobacteria bacterium]
MLRVGEFALATGGGVWVAAGATKFYATLFGNALTRFEGKLGYADNADVQIGFYASYFTLTGENSRGILWATTKCTGHTVLVGYVQQF